MKDSKTLRELRKCLGCPKYFWTVIQPAETDNWNERMKYCSDCWANRVQKSFSLAEVERENTEMSEEDKQAEETREQYGQNIRRWRAN